MAGKRILLPEWRWIVLAAAAGLLAGAGAVYVSGGETGNIPEVGGATATAQTDDADKVCAANATKAAAAGEAAVGEVAAMLGAQDPRSLAALSFNGPDGAPLTVGDFAGKTILLNLWATWCAPCRAEMPALDALQRNRRGDAFEVVTVNIDTGGDEKPRGFLNEIGVRDLALYRDPSLKIFNDLKGDALALGLPATMLIDPKGCLLAHMNGPAEWASPDATRLIDVALQP